MRHFCRVAVICVLLTLPACTKKKPAEAAKDAPPPATLAHEDTSEDTSEDIREGVNEEGAHGKPAT
jgi:predicted small lipoprotein YifL